MYGQLGWISLVPGCNLKVPHGIVKPYAQPVNGVAIVTVKTQENMREIYMHWEPEISVVKSEHKALWNHCYLNMCGVNLAAQYQTG